MKSVFLGAVLFLAALTTKTFANDVKVTPSTLVNFHIQFSDATNVQWSNVNHLYRADFTVEGEKTIAFFSKADGTLVVTCKYLTLTDLPRDLQRSLKKHMDAATLTELYVVKGDEVLDYYATIQQADQTVVLKSVFNKWVVHKKG